MNETTNSHILVNEFEYLEPATLDEATALLSRYGSQARVLAGGTDLLVQMKMERIKPAVVVSIRRIPGLDVIELRADGLHVGAMATIREVRDHPAVRQLYPALADACASFSTTQIQVMGTVGGNLCNASPASDSAPALIAYGAQAVACGPDGERRMPVEDLFEGPGRSALKPGELLAEIVVPPQGPTGPAGSHSAGAAFLKISRVAADIAKANAGVWLAREGDVVTDCRLAFGSVAPTPVRTRAAENVLIGQRFSPELVAHAAQAAASEVTPIDDIRSGAWYRRQIVAVMTHDGLNRAWAASESTPLAGGNGHHGAREYAWPGEAAREAIIADGWPTRSPGIGRRDGGDAARRQIVLTVNGARRRLWVAANDLLLNVLRDELQLTGSKYGCGIGECSACTVEMDALPVLACLVLAVSADGSEIVTVEGLRKADGDLDPLQEAFLEHGAYQCGFCTPGMLMTARSLLRDNPHPDEDAVRDYLKGNLCRCTGYASIVRAVMAAGEESPQREPV